MSIKNPGEMRRCLATTVVLLLVTAGCAPKPPAWQTEDEAFRVTQEQALRAPDGWLAVAGLFFLKPGVSTVGADPARDVVLPPGSAPATVGRLVLTGTTVRFEPAPGVEARLNQAPLRGPVDLRASAPEITRRADRIAVGRVQFHLHISGDRIAIRLRDPESALRRAFTGTRWFPLDTRWRVAGTFLPYPEPRTMQMVNLLGDPESTVSRGEVVFSLEGQIVRLVAFEEDGQLWFVFRDATAPGESYATRFLYAALPGAEGRTILDFNRAENPPCAYNPFTTCPLPVPQNRLSLAIRAGERLPAHAPEAAH